MRNLALAAAAVLAAVAAAELAARAAAPADPFEALREQERRFLRVEPALPFFRREGGLFVAARARSSARPFPTERRAGEPLFFVVGESVAQRLPADVLSAALDGLAVNAGMGAYGSAAVRATSRVLLAHAPAGLIVLVGNNGAGPAVGGVLPRLAGRSRLARLWLDSRQPVREAGGAWEEDVRGLVREARRRGVKVILCTLPVNAGAPPHGALPLDDADFAAGWAALERGDAKGAARRWRTAAERKPDSAMPRYWLGRALGSDAELERAVELDYPDRCKPSRNALIRRIAAEEGAALADLDAAFARLGSRAEDFLDEVHWREAWHPIVVAIVAAAARDEAPPVLAPASRLPLSADEAGDVLRRALAYALQAGEQPRPVLHERLVFYFQRAWRERPELAAEALGSPEAASRLLSMSSWTRSFASPSARAWNWAVRHGDEARRRALSASAALRRP